MAPDEPPSAAYKALMAERYRASGWFTARIDNTDGPTARLMMGDEFNRLCEQSTGPCGQLRRDDTEGCDDGATMSEGRSRVNGTSPLGTTSTTPKGT